MLQLANPRHLSWLLHRLCGLCLAVTLGYLAITLLYLTISLHRPTVTLRCLGGAWGDTRLCLCLRLGEVGV